MNVWGGVFGSGLESTVLIWNNLIGIFLFWGSAQLVQFLHSIAWNTQEARRAQNKS